MGPAEAVKQHKDALQRFAGSLAEDFERGEPVHDLLLKRARQIDRLLAESWRHFLDEDAQSPALIAVGGYGRQELHPHSDIDILILLPPAATRHCPPGIGGFTRFLWDIGLRPGHSVRTLDQCLLEARNDQTVITNLLDARLIEGSWTLFQQLQQGIQPTRMWPSPAFFAAKTAEKRARYARYHDTAYNLEPNVKEGPGGLRDLQMIGWVLKRHFGTARLQDLVGLGFLTASELGELMRAQEFLWRIRFAVHTLAGRAEERLLFSHQRQLALRFGFRDDDANRAVERFMQVYFRTVKGLELLNDMLMQLFEESIVEPAGAEAVVPISERFQAVNDYIEVRRPDVFEREPLALLEIFRALQRNRQLKGVRASTIRLIRQNLHRIDDEFRADSRANALFMELLRSPTGVTSELRRMKRYGVLGAYLPSFARVTGMMQFDLFHVYTVDEHTLFVVRNLRRLSLAQHAEELPLARAVFLRVDQPELLYIAGLFHDIAKGSGGDHSMNGEAIVRQFAIRHRLTRYETEMVCWLVRNHLIMSLTAQRKDIEDPDVINAFAREVGSEERLNYLYLLTVADIRATNHKLWNAWRDALLKTLYLSSLRAFHRGLDHPLDHQDKIRGSQDEAMELLRAHGLRGAEVLAIWAKMPEDYFLRYTPEEIVWHTNTIARTQPQELPLVLVRPPSQRGGSEVFIYATYLDSLFAACTAVLDQLGLNIVDAKIIRLHDGKVLHSYFVLDQNGEPILHWRREREISERLQQQLRVGDAAPPPVERRHSPQFQHFPVPTRVEFLPDPQQRYSILELQATDRPGLLSKVGQAFNRLGLRVHSARVATIGSRAEDVFLVTDVHDRPILSRTKQRDLRRSIIEMLGV